MLLRALVVVRREEHGCKPAMRGAFDSRRHASHACRRNCRFNQRVNSHIIQCSRQVRQERSLTHITGRVSKFPVSSSNFAMQPTLSLTATVLEIEQQSWSCACATDLDSRRFETFSGPGSHTTRASRALVCCGGLLKKAHPLSGLESLDEGALFYPTTIV